VIWDIREKAYQISPSYRVNRIEVNIVEVEESRCYPSVFVCLRAAKIDSVYGSFSDHILIWLVLGYPCLSCWAVV